MDSLEHVEETSIVVRCYILDGVEMRGGAGIYTWDFEWHVYLG